MNTKTIKVVIVDDHPIIRKGLRLLINQESDMEVLAEIDNPQDAINVVEGQTDNLFLIVDLLLNDDNNGLELIKKIRNIKPKTQMLVLSMHDEFFYAERALRAGAKGYIMKQEPSEKVIQAIRKIFQGEVYLSDRMSEKLLKNLLHGKKTGNASVDSLSDREFEVFILIGQGWTTRNIAEKMNLSKKTIDTYREKIKEKLSLQNANQLIRYACQWTQENNQMLSPHKD